MPERLVICGGLPASGTGTKDIIALDVNGSDKSPSRVNLKLGDISTRMLQDIPPVLSDLLHIAVYVYCADQFTGRGGDTMPDLGKDWRRRFRFHMPVRRPEVWSRSDVQDLLVEALSFLSDDDYAFEFVPHPNPTPAGGIIYLTKHAACRTLGVQETERHDLRHHRPDFQRRERGSRAS